MCFIIYIAYLMNKNKNLFFFLTMSFSQQQLAELVAAILPAVMATIQQQQSQQQQQQPQQQQLQQLTTLIIGIVNPNVSTTVTVTVFRNLVHCKLVYLFMY